MSKKTTKDDTNQKKPYKDEPWNEGEKFFIESATREAFQLRTKIKMSEAFFHQGAWYSKQDARGHFAYGVLDEVLRVALTMHRWKEVIDWWEIQRKKDDPNDWIERLLYESINFEQKLWCRKLSEHLVSIILFSKHNKQSLYRIWLASRSLEKTISRYLDLKEYDNCKNQNVLYQIKHLVNDIRYEVKKEKLVADDLFFMKEEMKPIFLEWKKEEMKPIFSSYEKLLKISLGSITDPTDRLILGPSYEHSYWRLSEVVHANDWVGDPEISLGHIKAEFYLAWMYCSRIIMWLYEILWIEKTGWSKQLESMFKSDKIDAPILYKNTHQKEFENGDLIFCQNVFAEILEKKVSKYGNTSYKIQFLWRAPIPEIPIEEVPSRSIQACILKKSWAKNYLEKDILWENISNPAFDELSKIKDEIDNSTTYEMIKSIFIDIDRALKGQGWLIRIYIK